MKCPYCQNPETKVVDSRETDDGRVIRRRRECANSACAARFSTYEQVEMLSLVVVKKDGKKEEYQKEKLEKSLRIATNKCLDENEVIKLVLEIETKLQLLGRKEITSQEIGELILELLKNKNQVSYLRFASVFKSFGNGKQFLKELNKLEGID